MIIKYYLPLCLALLIGAVGCRKQENIDFKFDNELDYVETDLDRWLTGNFTDPYNMEIIYRFDRYKMGDLNVNLVPAKEEKVKEQMGMIMDGFIQPFQEAGGIPFVKTYLPKEWLLSGSFHINSSGERILATSSGGRNITIYEVNTVDVTDVEVTRRKLKTVHHEFAHTLTQLVRIPREFESISEANYSADWSNSYIWPDAKNNEQGFVSRYARSSVMEDFAETVGFLLVYGQVWYDTKASAMPKSGYDIMKAKEAAVVKFYRDNYAVDFRKLQEKILIYMRSNIKKESFRSSFFNQNLKARTVSLSKSANGTRFGNVSQDFKNQIAADIYGAWTMSDLGFTFTPKDANSGELLIKLSARLRTAPVTTYDFTFVYQIDPTTEKITFTKLPQSTGGQYANHTILMKYFLPTISDYFTSGPFSMDWSLSKPLLTYFDEGYYNFGGFYKNNDRADYIDFELNQL